MTAYKSIVAKLSKKTRSFNEKAESNTILQYKYSLTQNAWNTVYSSFFAKNYPVLLMKQKIIYTLWFDLRRK